MPPAPASCLCLTSPSPRQAAHPSCCRDAAGSCPQPQTCPHRPLFADSGRSPQHKGGLWLATPHCLSSPGSTATRCGARGPPRAKDGAEAGVGACRQGSKGSHRNVMRGQRLSSPAGGKAPFASTPAHTGGRQPAASPWHSRAFSSSPQCVSPPHASTAGSTKPARHSEAISRHSPGTEPHEAAQGDPAMSTDSK